MPSSIFPSFNRQVTELWDREWVHYLSTEQIFQHAAPASRLKLIGNLKGASPSVTYHTVLAADERYGNLDPLKVWCAGDAIIDRSVLELGCGCGSVGKQLALVCRDYLGLDYSELAIAIARGTSPPNCEFRHISDHEALDLKRGKYDVMVARHFFIHQNFDSALNVLRIAKFLLKPNGLVCADFYFGNPAVRQGVVYRAKSPLDPRYPSCGFEYSPQEMRELADAGGFKIRSTEIGRQQQRCFVMLESCS